MEPSLLNFPSSFELIEVLVEHGAASTSRGRLGDEEVALRLSPGDALSESFAELRTLAAIRHPGIAPLVEHGTLPDSNVHFVARGWIDGVDFATWSQARSAREICQVAAQLCPALAHLHRQGFLHADLKPENVVVRPDGTPVLTDFGLSCGESAPDSKRVSGSWVSLAPELLLGKAPSVQSDVFSFGVLLYRCLSHSTPDPALLYARFPATSFLDAVGANVDGFPAETRDVLARCLARDPGHRPESFEELEQILSGRYELSSAEGSSPLSMGRSARWPLRAGREEWLEDWARDATKLSAEGVPPTPQWLVLPAAEQATVFLDDLRLFASLSGLSGTAVDLSHLVRDVSTTAEVDRVLAEFIEQVSTQCVFVKLTRPDRWSARALECLLHSARQTGSNFLLVTASDQDSRPAPAAETDEVWVEQVVPSSGPAQIRSFLTSALEVDEPERLVQFAALLDQECVGSATRLDLALRACGELGWIVDGDDKPRLRANVSWNPTALRSRIAPTKVAVGAEVGAFNKSVLRRAHAFEARRLAALDADSMRVLPHAWAADSIDSNGLTAESRDLRDGGRAELAVDMLSEAHAFAESLERPFPPVLVAELATNWIAIGQYGRAEELHECLSSPVTDEERAAQSLVSGQLATRKGEHAQALQEFERALTLDPAHSGAALMAKARLLYETRQDEALESLVAELPHAHRAQVNQRQVANFMTMLAMSQHRRGLTAEAEETLSGLYATADERGDAIHKAVLATNLASIARRRGDFERALTLFSQAETAYEHAGHLPGMAQARNLRGGVLRELGELSEALPLLTAALRMRERLGDRRGMLLTRGIIAMLRSDAGELHAADVDLGRCVEGLSRMNSGVEAQFLRAVQAKVRSRIGRPEPDLEAISEQARDADPRIRLALGLAALNRGRSSEAVSLLEQSLAVAERLGWRGAADEAALALRVATGGDPSELVSASQALREGQRVHELLLGTVFDEQAVQDLARELEQRGRYDRAARLWLAIGHRSADEESCEHAERLLAKLSRGLTAAESTQLRASLLEVPDPCPDDLGESALSTEEDSVKDLETFLSINKRLAEQEDLGTLLGAIVDSAIAVTHAARGFLVLEEEGDLRFDTALDSRHGDIDYPEMKTSSSVIRQSLKMMRPLRLKNASADPRWESARSIKELQLRSVMCAPFQVDESLRGVIYVDDPDMLDLFEERAEFLLSHLASQAGIAIRQVRRTVEIQRLNSALEVAIHETRSDLRTAREALREAGLAGPASGLIGNSVSMKRVHDMLERVAPSLLPVLITGASGTGKEMAARALHSLGPRASEAFVSENCASLPASLAESELFGYQKGAFTGALRDRSGMFERAHGGTLFLDEIGELPIELQAKLLRVLETGELRRIGGDDIIHCDVRLVAATNRDIERDLADGRFRSDLFYRLNAIRIEMPLLADRVEDIPELVRHFLQREAARSGMQREVSLPVLRALCEREWPGNVRELANEVDRLCLMSDGNLDDPELVLPASFRGPALRFGQHLTLAMIERSAIEEAIERFEGDKKRAASYLGISRTKIYDCLARWKVDDARQA